MSEANTPEKKQVHSNELLPCPFCGEKEDIVVRVEKYHGAPLEVAGKKFWRVECLPCACQTGRHFDGDAELEGWKCDNPGKQAAIAAWNKRAS